MNKTSLILSTALLSALATSTAFAQDAQQKQSTPPEDATQQATDAASAAQPAQKSWADLDSDKNGSLSMAEASAHQGMSQVFAKADADGNGELTGDEYKAYLEAGAKTDKADSADKPKQ